MNEYTTFAKNSIALDCIEKLVCLERFISPHWPQNLDYDLPQINPTYFVPTNDSGGGLGLYLNDDILIFCCPGVESFTPGLTSSLVDSLFVGAYSNFRVYPDLVLNSIEPRFIIALRNIILQNLQIRKILLTGHSYGCAVVTMFGYVLQCLNELHSNPNCGKDVKTFCEYIYQTHMATDIIIAVQKGDKSTTYLQKLNLPSTKNTDDILQAIKNLDQDLFSNIIVDGVYLFGGPTFFTNTSTAEYNEILLNKTYNFYL